MTDAEKVLEREFEEATTVFAGTHRSDTGSVADGDAISGARQRLRAVHERALDLARKVGALTQLTHVLSVSTVSAPPQSLADRMDAACPCRRDGCVCGVYDEHALSPVQKWCACVEQIPNEKPLPREPCRWEWHTLADEVREMERHKVPSHYCNDPLKHEDGTGERIAALERERDLLADKWRQMETYGFDSPSAVFARLQALERENEALREQASKVCVCHIPSEDPCPRHP